MANPKPAKINTSTGKVQRFESGDFINLSEGGTNADLSATGGSGHVLKQSSVGAAITVGAIAAGDLPAGIDAAKIGDGSVSNTEFQRLGSVTGPLVETTGSPAANQIATFNSSTILQGVPVYQYAFQVTPTTTARLKIKTNIPVATDRAYFITVEMSSTQSINVGCRWDIWLRCNGSSYTTTRASCFGRCVSGGTATISTDSSKVSINLTAYGTSVHMLRVTAFSEIGADSGLAGWTAADEVVGSSTASNSGQIQLSSQQVDCGIIVSGTDPGGSEQVRIGGSMRMTGQIFAPTSGGGMFPGTSDASDTGALRIGGGGGNTNTRGAFTEWCGNEHATTPGAIQHVMGGITGSKWLIRNGSSVILFQINDDKTVALDSTFSENLSTALISTAGPGIAALTSKTTPVSTDSFIIQDSEASNAAKELSYGDLVTSLSSSISSNDKIYQSTRWC